MREHMSISIADQVFRQLERDILTGKYRKGEILSELRLSNELGVSRTPVREAVRRLQQEQLIKDTKKGLEVLGISLEDTLDMYDIRLETEGIAAGRAAEKITGDDLKKMRDILELQSFYIEKSITDNSDKIRDMDSEFHELLYKCSGSIVFYYVLSSLHRKICKFREVSVTKQSRAVDSMKEHMAIYEALSRHDKEAAKELARQHVINARESISEMRG